MPQGGWALSTERQEAALAIDEARDGGAAGVPLPATRLRGRGWSRNSIASNLRLTSGSAGTLVEYDSNATKMLGEVLLPVPTAEGQGSQEWAVVDIYMVAKPF